MLKFEKLKYIYLLNDEPEDVGNLNLLYFNTSISLTNFIDLNFSELKNGLSTTQTIFRY